MAARGTAAVQPLLAVFVLAGSAVYSQITLLVTNTPATSRTWANLAAAAVVIALLLWGVLRGPDPEPVQIPAPAVDPLGALPLETRELIYRHPELLVAFERWHRTHREET